MIASLCTPIKFESNVVMYDGFVVENKTHFLIYIIVEKKNFLFLAITTFSIMTVKRK